MSPVPGRAHRPAISDGAMASGRSRHRVETGAGPAAQQAACGQPASVDRSVPLYRLGRVLRAARRLRAGRRQGAELCLVEADAVAHQPGRPTVGLGTRSVLDGRDVRLGPVSRPCRGTNRSHGGGGKQQRVDEGNHATARHAAGRPHGHGRRRHQLADRLPRPDSHCCPPRGLPVCADLAYLPVTESKNPETHSSDADVVPSARKTPQGMSGCYSAVGSSHSASIGKDGMAGPCDGSEHLLK
jgi:hypothetical protein